MTPWTAFWERNRFTDPYPRLEAVIESPYVRGAATGVGVITMLAGLGELGALFVTRWRGQEAPGAADDAPRA